MSNPETQQHKECRKNYNQSAIVTPWRGDAAKENKANQGGQYADKCADCIITMANGSQAAAKVHSIEGEHDQTHGHDCDETVLSELLVPTTHQGRGVCRDAFTTKPAYQGKAEVGAGVLTDDGEEGAEPWSENQSRCDCQKGGREENQGAYSIEDDVNKSCVDQPDVVEPLLQKCGYAGQGYPRLPPVIQGKEKQAEPEAAEDELERRILQMCANRGTSKGAP